MEVVNNMVSETPVLEVTALEELKAFLDLQTKMAFEALDERIAARDANRGALFGRFGARPSGGSGVLDAVVAQEVIPDFNLVVATNSAANDEPSDVNTGARSSCSTKCRNRAIDISMPVPACILVTEVIPELNHVADATSAIYAKSCDIDIGAFTKCSTKCPSHTYEFTASAAVEELFADHVVTAATSSDSTSSCIGAPFTTSTANTFAMGSCFKLLEELRQMELLLGRKLDVQYEIPSVAVTSAISTFNDVNLDKYHVFDEEPTVFDEGPIFDEEPTVFDEGPIFDEEPTVFDEGPVFDEELLFDKEHIPNLVPSSANIVTVDIFHTVASAPRSDTTTVCAGVVLSETPDANLDNTSVVGLIQAHGINTPVLASASKPATVARSFLASSTILSIGSNSVVIPHMKLEIMSLPAYQVLEEMRVKEYIGKYLNISCIKSFGSYSGYFRFGLPFRHSQPPTMCMGFTLIGVEGLLLPWPPPAQVKIVSMGAKLRPTPWPSFLYWQGVLLTVPIPWPQPNGPRTSSELGPWQPACRSKLTHGTRFLHVRISDEALSSVLTSNNTCWNIIRDASMLTSVLTSAMLFSIHGLRMILKQLKHCEKLVRTGIHTVTSYSGKISFLLHSSARSFGIGNFGCEAKEIVDYHGDDLQFSVGPVQVSGSSTLKLGFLIMETMLSRLSTAGEYATLLQQPWPPPIVYVHVEWGAICGHGYARKYGYCKMRKAMGLYQFGQSNYSQVFCKVKAFRLLISASVGFIVLHMTPGLCYGADQMYIQSSRGMVVILVPTPISFRVRIQPNLVQQRPLQVELCEIQVEFVWCCSSVLLQKWNSSVDMTEASALQRGSRDIYNAISLLKFRISLGCNYIIVFSELLLCAKNYVVPWDSSGQQRLGGKPHFKEWGMSGMQQWMGRHT